MANRRFIDFPIATTVGDNDIILIWQSGMNKQTTKATLLNGLPENLEDLLDVNITGLTNGQILRYDSVTGKWENTDQGNLDLDDLNDVTIVSPTNGQVLVYNSSTSKWENSSAGFVPYTGAISTVNLGAQTIQAGSFVKSGGTSSQFLKADGSVDSTAYGTGSVTSVGLTMPSAFNVANSPVTTSGTLAVTGAGTVGQYIRGDGSLADFPSSTGGGSSVSYYLNGSVSQGTIGGVAYKELSKVPILGTGTDFTINANGYIAQFLTDAGDPNLLEIPGGNWNFETYFSASSGGGSPTFYVELYKYDGSTFTLIASNSGNPELIAFGTNVTSYFSTLAVPTTALALTDRLAIRYYVTHSGRTITLHTENNHLCQVITTFTTGLTALNGLTAQVQYFAVGTSGTDFNIASATQTHTFNLPTASASNRGALSSADWTTFNNKQNALINPVTGTGTTNYLPKFTGTSSIGNSIVQDAGIRVDIGGDIRLTPSSAVNIQAYTGSVYTNLFYNAASHNWQNSGGATKMFLNSNDNLLIGTTSDGGQRLQVTGTFALRASASISSATQIPIFNADPSGTTRELVTRTPAQLLSDIGGQAALTNPVTGTGTTNYLPKFTGSTTIGNSNLINDASGNLGLGVTPSAWLNTLNALQIGAAHIFGQTTGTGTVSLGNNAFLNSTPAYIYQYNGKATRYSQYDGQHEWYNASSGTAGNAISFTQAMTLDASGNLLIGATSNISSARREIVIRGANGSLLSLGNNTTADRFQIVSDSGENALLNNKASTPMIFYTSNTEAMRITSGGNLLVGTTSDAGYRLEVAGVIRANGGQIIVNNVANNWLQSNQNGTSAQFQTWFASNGTTRRGYFGYPSGASDNFTLMNEANGQMAFGTNGSTALTLASTGAATFSSSVTAASLSLSGTIASSGDAATLTIKQAGTTFTNGIYLERASERNGYYMYIGGALDALNFRRNYFGTQSDVMSLTRDGNVGIGTTNPLQKLHITQAADTAYPTLGTGKGALFIAGDTNLYGLYVGINTNDGNTYFQAMRNNSATAYNITMQAAGGNVLIGTTTDNSHKLRVNGTGYFDTGIKTGNPVGSTTNDWLLGRALVTGTSTPDRWIRVQIGNLYYDILAVYMGSV